MKENYYPPSWLFSNVLRTRQGLNATAPNKRVGFAKRTMLLMALMLFGCFSTSWSQIALPYSETFAGITAANGFPTVTGGAWTRSGTATNQPTYIANQSSYNRSGNGDTKFIAFRYDNSTRYFFVGPFALTAGTSYTSSCLYKADGLSGFGPLALTYGTTAAAGTQTTTIASIPANIVNAAYATLTGNFTVATSGNYYLAVKCTANGNPWYLSVDDFKLNVTPACSSPTSLAGVQTTLTTANISWTAPTTGTPVGYEYAVTTSSTPPASGTPVTATSVTGATATANTTNYLHVRTNCNTDGYSSWATTSFYVGYCTPTTTYGCTDGDVIARVTLNTLDNNSGTGCPSGTAGYSNYTANSALTTTLQAGSSYSCTVYAGQYPEGYAAWIDYNDDGIFDNATERIGYSNGQVAGSGTVGVLGASSSFPIVLACNPPTGAHRLRVRAMYNLNGSAVTPCTANSFGEVEDYKITITAADPCPAPNTLAAANVTYNSAQLSWVLGCAETTWEIKVQPAGSGVPSSGGEITSTTFNAGGLTPSTNYEFYVRAVCQSGVLYSTWSGPFTFATTAIPPDCVTTEVYPLNNATDVAVVNGGITLQWAAPSTGPVPTSYNVYVGTTSGALSLIGNVTTTSMALTGFSYSTPYFWRIAPVNSGGSPAGCIEWKFTTQAIPANDTCAGATSLDALTSPLSSTTVGLTNDYTPPCYTGTATAPESFYSITVPLGYTLVIGQTVNYYDSYNAVFYGTCAAPTAIACFDTDIQNITWVNTTGATQTVYWVQDGYSAGAGEFTLAWSLTPPPACVQPSAVTATPTSLTTANISWTAPSTGTPIGYEYAVTTSATPPASGTPISTTSVTGVTVTTDATNYLHVRTNCDTDGYSVWATTSFYVGYCVPTTTYGCTDGDVIARVTLNTLDNNSGTGCPSGTAGYSNYTANTALTTTLQAGSSYNCTVYAGEYSEGYAAWVDYNDDGVFDNATERIGYSNGMVTGSGLVGVLGSSASFPIVLACNPPLGQHRLRVRAMFNTAGSAVTPCANNSFGEVEDYLITITAADPCPAPHTLAANTVTPTSANLTWVLGCAETEWEIVVQPAGTGVPTGAGTVVTSTTYAATTTAGVSYEFYVRAACQAGVLYSSWSGPFSFTKPDCAAIVYPADAATDVTFVNGVIALDWDAPTTGGAPTSYNIYAGITSTSLSLVTNTTATTLNVTADYDTTYFWQVVPVNGSGTATGCAIYSFTTASLPANDVCSGAISLDALTSPLTSSTVGLTDDYTASCDSSFDGSPDSFYSITVPNGYTLVIGQTANDYDSVYAVFYGNCASPTAIACSDEPDIANVTWVNTTGSSQTVYWVQDGYEADSGVFTIAWTLTAPANCYTWTGVTSTAWSTATNWCGGLVPTATSDVTIPDVANDPVVTTGTAYANNLTIATGATLTVNTGATLNVENVLASQGTLTIQNNAALVQGESTVTSSNTGNITVKKNSNSLFRLDYTMWSSPVSGTQTLLDFSPLTNTTRFYEYKYATPAGGGAAVEQYFDVAPASTFAQAKGYLIRMPNTDATAGYNTGDTAIVHPGSFTGVPNNGTISYPASTVGDKYTAVGNPYPSPISVVDFYAENSNVVESGSAIYFWRKKNNAAVSSYAYVTLAGLTANGASGTAGYTQGGQDQSGFYVAGQSANYLISQGQGFIVKTKDNPTVTNIVFKNSMRRGAPGSTQAFFKSAGAAMSRYWLNISGANNGFSQAAVAYMEGGTLGLDYGYDGKKFTDGGSVALYSLAADTNLAIQARPEFEVNDVVPMGFEAVAPGQFTISLDHFDGLFEGDQNIYIKDNLEGLTHNLKNGEYTFTSEAGTFTNRFEVVYTTQALGTDNPVLNANSVIVYKQGTTININSGTAAITGVTIYDIRGRKLYSQSNINATQTAITGLQVQQEVLIVEVNTVKGKVSKRLVF